MLYCVNCGKENSDTAKFCTGCGKSLSSVPQQKAFRQTPVRNKWIALGLLAAVILIVGFYFLFIYENKTKVKGISTVEYSHISENQSLAQPFVDKLSYSKPLELLYTGKIEKEKFPNTRYPGFFPIGWSRDGKFAYAEEPVDEACGCYFFNIYIQDMYSDKILWTWAVELNEDDDYNSSEENSLYFKKTWDKNNTMFTQKLNQYQIEPLTFSSLENLPIRVNNNECSFIIRNNSFYEDAFGQNVIASTSVTMLINGIEKKKIFKHKYALEVDGKLFSGTLSNKIIGYIKNPFENRIALFLLNEQRGYEGPPNIMNFNLIGCDLNNIGF